MIVLDSITVEDFGSYAGEQTLPLGGRGPVAVVGSNGNGKSTIGPKALTWCLHGTTSPERMGGGTHRLKGKHVVREGAKSCRVALVLRDTETKQVWRIERSRKLSGSDTIRLWSGVTEIVDADQDHIDRLIGVPADLFVRTVVRGQNDPWAFAEATDAKKREILDAISGADKYGPLFEKAKKLRKDMEARASRLHTQIGVRNQDLKRGREQYAGVVAQHRAWSVGRQAKQAEMKTKVENARVYLEQARALDADLEQARARREEHMAKKPTADLTPWTNATAAARAQHLQAQAAVHQEESAWRAGVCHACGQKLPGHGEPDSRALERARTVLQKAESALQAAQAAEKQKRAWLQHELTQWQDTIDTHFPPAASPQATPDARRRLELAETELKHFLEADNPWTEAELQQRSRLYDLEREHALMSSLLSLDTEDLEKARVWESLLSPTGIRARLAEAALAGIETEANKWLGVLSEGKMSIEFNATSTTQAGQLREKIDTVVRYKGQDRPLLNYSGGEKRRVNLAVDLGVASTFAKGGALSLSLLMLDEECFSGLDTSGKRAVVSALYHAGVADVVVIDHDPALTGSLHRTYEVVRGQDGWSKLKEVS